jgi:ketosteroid isomerase-like protein
MFKRALVFSVSCVFAASVCAAQSMNKDLTDLATAERAFAATAVKEGFRDSFIKFFADDGIGFAPHPHTTRAELMKTPLQTGPRRVVFNWQPMFGDISIAGDLGYTTGPVLFTDATANPKPPRHGMYFSVWQKQSDGRWKVAVDMGSDMPRSVAPLDAAFTPSKRQNAATTASASDASYAELDQKLSTDIAQHGVAKGYLLHLDDEFRLHRSGHLPILNKADLAKYFDVGAAEIVFRFIGGKTAISNDLAFSYGEVMPIGSKEAKGYYVHVWRKDRSGKWKLVADVENDLPKK